MVARGYPGRYPPLADMNLSRNVTLALALLVQILILGCSHDQSASRDPNSQQNQKQNHTDVETEDAVTEKTIANQRASRLALVPSVNLETAEVGDFILVGGIIADDSAGETAFSLLKKSEIRFFTAGEMMMSTSGLWCDPKDKDKVVDLVANLPENQQRLFFMNSEPYTRWEDSEKNR